MDRDESNSKCQGSRDTVVFGVDLNVTGHFAALSTGLFLGSAGYINIICNEYEEKCGKL